MDIPEHLIPFGQEACPGWALERKVIKIPGHSDTVQLPLRPGRARLVRSESAPPWGVLPAWCGSGNRDNPRVVLLWTQHESPRLTFMIKWRHHSLWPCWVWVVERNVLLENCLVFFPVCSDSNSPMLAQCPGGEGEGWGWG